MRPSSRELWKLLHNASQGCDLSKEEIKVAASYLDNARPGALANACEIIYRSSRSTLLRRRALDTLEKLCRAGGEGEYVVTMLTAMLFVPVKTLSERRSIKEFLTRCGASRRWQIRVNAINVLERLAHAGDSKALDSIRVLTGDKNEYVRGNSLNSMSRLTSWQ